MKKTKTEIALIRDEIAPICDEIALIWDAIHGILVRNRNTDTMLEVNSTADNLNSHDVIEMRTRTTCLESEVVGLMRWDEAKDNRIEDLERRLKKQEEIICRLLTDMSTLATDYMDLRVKLGDMATTVASLVADKDALISHNRCRSQRENELQAQVDELQTKVNDQAEALEHLSTEMESVAKALTNLDGWMDSVVVVLSALRKST